MHIFVLTETLKPLKKEKRYEKISQGMNIRIKF